MSIYIEIVIWCNMCGNSVRFTCKKLSARHQAKLEGWTFNKKSKEDFCPNCTKLNKEKIL
jgi:hypothetical protein